MIMTEPARRKAPHEEEQAQRGSPREDGSSGEGSTPRAARREGNNPSVHDEHLETPVAEPTPVEEMVLVNKARQGDLEAYDELVKRYQERIYATIYHMTSNHEDANDLAQEAFIKAYQALKSFKGGSSFYTWVYRIAVNKTINFLKQRKNKAQMSLDDLDFNAEHDPDLVALISDKTPRREVNLAELQEKLNIAMQKLSEPHRLVVTLHDVQGLSHEEIAKIMECNIGTVRSRLFYARQQLQAYLSDYLK
jgi:RNA polymerase sigma-70 factor (ECF subfamily)